MLPVKRSRNIPDEDNSSSEAENQGIRKSVKRQRRGIQQSQSDPEIDDEDTSSGSFRQVPKDEVDSDDNEEAMEVSTQKATRDIVANYAKNSKNTPADFGIVTAIELENFMCHSHLEVKLGPLINFIIGHNGSGKSAILTGLTLCLGGKATSTNRGSSLKSFIKEGQSQARITLKLKNGGDGFKPDIYGDIIIVERSFSREGSSSYKLKSRGGRLISNKREELDEICDYMGLQVDNPMNILTQDAARQFINNSSEREKYKFFIKGVQLEQLHQDYKLLIDSITNTEATLETKRSHMLLLKRQWEEAKKKFDQCKSHEQIQQKMTQLSHQMAWVQVEDQEKLLEQVGITIKETEDRIGRIQVKINDAETAYDKTNAAQEVAGASLAAESDRLKPIEEEEFQLKEKMDNNRKELGTIQSDMRDAAGQVQGQKKKIAELERKVRQEEERLRGLDGGSNARLVSEKEEIIHEREQLMKLMQELEIERDKQQNQVATARESTQNAQRQIQNKQMEIENVRKQAQELRKVQNEYMATYGPQMQNLLKAIDEAAGRGGWKEKPIGPLGQHITLLKQDWSPILETIFGRGISGFIVTNYDDQTLLRRLMSRCRCDFPVSICKNTPIRLQKPDAKYDTILNVLDISNPLVVKHLVIQNGIEQSLLFEDQEEANAVWATVTETDNRRIQACYAKNQGRRGWGLRIGGRVGVNAVKPVKPWNGAPRMKSDLESHMRDVQLELEQLEKELDDMKKLKREKDQAVAEIEHNLRSFESRKRKLRIDKQRLDDRIEKIANDIEENFADSRLGTFETQLDTLQKGLDADEKVYVELAASRMKLNQEQNSLKQELNNLKDQLDTIRTGVRQQERELSDAMGRRQQALADKNHWYNKLETEQKELRRQNQIYTLRERIVQEHTTKANAVCHRIEIDKGTTAEKLDQTLKKLHYELEESQKRIGGSAQEVARACDLATTTYQAAKHDLEQMRTLLEVMKQSYRDRTYRWGKFRHYISARARAQFMWLMSQRAYRGRLRTDHKNQLLKLEVQPSQQESDAGRGPKTLSGGERSFSTVCLLLALWEAMGSPIRCLDEFDVFMDSVNRTISVKMMIEAARRSIGKQFILITPQDMSSIDSSADVKVTRLRDPERNQGSLNLTRG